MANKKKTLLVSGMLMLSIGLTACQTDSSDSILSPKNEEAPEVTLQHAMVKMSDVKSYGFDVTMSGDLNGPTGETPEKVGFNFNLNGGVDMVKVEDPRLNLNMKGAFNADKDKADAEFQLRFNKDAVYANLVALNGSGEMEMPEEFKTMLINKWWTLPIPPEFLVELKNSMPENNEENLTPEQKQIKDLVEKTQFFKNVKRVGNEKVAGEESAHFTADFDKEAFANFVEGVSKIQGEEFTDTDREDLKKGLESINFSGDLFVGSKSGLINKVKGTINLNDKEKSGVAGKVQLEVSISNINKPVVIEVPENAEEVPMEALSSLFSM